jgi:hypothetical protein
MLVIQSRRMRWVGHVARIRGKWEIHREFWSKTLKGRDHLESLGVDGRIILE